VGIALPSLGVQKPGGIDLDRRHKVPSYHVLICQAKVDLKRHVAVESRVLHEHGALILGILDRLNLQLVRAQLFLIAPPTDRLIDVEADLLSGLNEPLGLMAHAWRVPDLDVSKRNLQQKLAGLRVRGQPAAVNERWEVGALPQQQCLALFGLGDGGPVNPDVAALGSCDGHASGLRLPYARTAGEQRLARFRFFLKSVPIENGLFCRRGSLPLALLQFPLLLLRACLKTKSLSWLAFVAQGLIAEIPSPR
jgi:hypothetical protein